MVIPSMYGGRKFYTPQWDYKRVRLPRANQLIPGDILVSRTSSAERLHLAYGRDFAILRPSLAIK